MGLADDLLGQADHLAVWDAGNLIGNPSQASLRRAVSTAYYALFHLLIEDAASRWDGSGEARSGLERAFTHGSMKQASLQFRQPVWQDWHGRQQPIPLAVQQVASIFVDLQEERHTADYDNHERWSVTEVQTTLNMAHAAFVEWKSVRTDPVAGNYLLAMLVKKPR